MELTTENLIKIAIGVFVIVVVVLGIYFAMRGYIIPYFSGINFEEPKININTAFGKELVQEKNKVGRFDDEGFFIYNNIKTGIYFKKDKIYFKKTFSEIEENDWRVTKWLKDLKPDEKIGYLDSEGKIVIQQPVENSEAINGAYINGKEIYKIGGDNK